MAVDPISFVYAITSVAIGLTVGIMAYKGWIPSLWKAIGMGFVVGLEYKLEENPYDLTLSDRKLISIASILAMDTEIIIFDEPTIAQD